MVLRINHQENHRLSFLIRLMLLLKRRWTFPIIYRKWNPQSLLKTRRDAGIGLVVSRGRNASLSILQYNVKCFPSVNSGRNVCIYILVASLRVLVQEKIVHTVMVSVNKLLVDVLLMFFGFLLASKITSLQTCKFFPNCTNIHCSFYHPKVCKFGKFCKNQAECQFAHVAKGSFIWKSTA